MPVRPEYRFRISVPYVKSAADNTQIAADKLLNKKWGKGYTAFRNRIRDHLKVQQNGRCAFCRCYVSNGTSYANLEHLLSKSDYSQFEFTEENLVHCCWLCNKGKRIRNTLSVPVAVKTQQTLPTTSVGYVIVNPYYDDYELYIDFIDDIIITAHGLSVKGPNTILYYNLTRPELAEERAREFKLNLQNINYQLMQNLITYQTQPAILGQLQQIIARLPNWTI